MIKVSIIVPVYNVEAYLPTCLDSLMGQTLEEIEIIVVNDGSPDGSFEIAKEYEKNSEKLKVYSIENHGVSYARNYGAEQARGEYLLFVDSDDYIEETMCEIMYDKAVRDHNDIVQCNRVNFYEDDAGHDVESLQKRLTISQNFKLRDMPFEMVWLSPFPWDKLVKRELFMQVHFPENIRFEDLAYVLKVSTIADCIGTVQDGLYHYRRTTKGGFLNTFSEETLDIVKAFQDVLSFMRERGYFEVYKEELAYISARHFFYRYPALFENRDVDIKLKKQMIHSTHEFLNQNFPGWKNNHYLKYSSAPAIRDNLPLYTDEGKLKRQLFRYQHFPDQVLHFLEKISIKRRNFFNDFKRMPFKKAVLRHFKIARLFQMPQSYYFTRAYESFPVDKKQILLESKHGEDIAGNIFNIMRVLHKPGYKDYRILLALTEETYARFDELRDIYDLNRVEPITIRSGEYYRALAEAGFLVTDTSFPTWFVKKKDQIYLNTWHGTPLKGMGRKVPGREFAQGNVQRNFLISDLLLFQDEFSRDVFMEDYMLENIYPGEVVLQGYPRNSALFNKGIEGEIRRDHHLENKQLIAYMPTWRGTLHKKDFDKQVKVIQQYLAEIDCRLRDDQIFFVKLHPFVGEEMDYSAFSHVQPFLQQYDTYDFLNATDILVTDYSSIMFDYAVTGKKIILFAYDKEEYLEDRGMYLDIEKLEFPVVEHVDELVREFDRENAGYPEFQKIYCPYDYKEAGEDILRSMLTGEPCIRRKKIEKDDGKNILIYLDLIGYRKQFQKAIADVNQTVGDGNHYFISFKAKNAAKNTLLLRELDPSIGYLALAQDMVALKREYAARWLYLKLGMKNRWIMKQIRRYSRRQVRCYYGDVEFDEIIYYMGRSRMNLQLLSEMKGKKCCNLMSFSENKYQKNNTYHAQINRMLTGESLFDLYCINEEFSRTKIFKKTKDKLNYRIIEPEINMIQGLRRELS